MLPFTIISIPFLSSFLIELLLMVHNKLKSDGNYLTGAIPSEVQALSAFTGPNKGEFMLKLSSTVKNLRSLLQQYSHFWIPNFWMKKNKNVGLVMAWVTSKVLVCNICCFIRALNSFQCWIPLSQWFVAQQRRKNVSLAIIQRDMKLTKLILIIVVTWRIVSCRVMDHLYYQASVQPIDQNEYIAFTSV